jgi:hypothetical protein
MTQRFRSWRDRCRDGAVSNSPPPLCCWWEHLLICVCVCHQSVQNELLQELHASWSFLDRTVTAWGEADSSVGEEEKVGQCGVCWPLPRCLY